MKNVLYVVTWGNASVTDEGNGCAYCGCLGCFTSKQKALKEMTKYKDSYIRELINEVEDEEDRLELIESIQVYGGEYEEYYEIDYTYRDNMTTEHYIRLQEIYKKKC